MVAAYVTLHLANHALGLISIAAMERVREGMQAVWGMPAMLALLYGSFAVHFALALVALYRRSTLRMPAWEGGATRPGPSHRSADRSARDRHPRRSGTDWRRGRLSPRPGRHLDRRLQSGAADAALARRVAACGRRIALLAAPPGLVSPSASVPLRRSAAAAGRVPVGFRGIRPGGSTPAARRQCERDHLRRPGRRRAGRARAGREPGNHGPCRFHHRIGRDPARETVSSAQNGPRGGAIACTMQPAVRWRRR